MTKCSSVKNSPWISELFELLSQSYWKHWLMRMQDNDMATILQYLNNKIRLLQSVKVNLVSTCMLLKKWSHTSFLLVIGIMPEIAQCIWEQCKNYQIPCLTNSWMVSMWSITRIGSSTESGVTWWLTLLTWNLEKVFNEFYKLCVFYANITYICNN